MVESVLQNLIVTLLATVVAATCKRFWKWLCKPPPTKSEILSPQYSVKEIKQHFWISLSVFVFAIIVYTTISSTVFNEDPTFLKALLLFIAAFAFMSLWASFDTALLHVPQNDIEIPPDKSTDKD